MNKSFAQEGKSNNEPSFKATTHLFQNEKYLLEATTHKSYAYENPMSGNHNEKLEFLGDSIISFVVADYLYQTYGDYKEGELTMLRAKLVCKQTLAEFARILGLNDKLKLGVGALSSNARNNEKVLEDAFEAYIGAVFLDVDREYGQVYEHMKPLLAPKVKQLIEEGINSSINPEKPEISSPIIGPRDTSLPNLLHEDPINKLQTWSQRRDFGLPHYKELGSKGQAHNPQFTFEVVIKGKSYGQGTARNKKDAKKQAAINTLKSIVPQDSGDKNDKNYTANDAVNGLQNLNL